MVRLSLRSQFIAKNVLFHCNDMDGINVEHESKLWLDQCKIIGSMGAAIHVNSGCKCLLTQTNIVCCGQGGDDRPSGQGAVVIYGNDTNYAKHLVMFYFIFLFLSFLDCL